MPLDMQSLYRQGIPNHTNKQKVYSIKLKIINDSTSCERHFLSWIMHEIKFNEIMWDNHKSLLLMDCALINNIFI